MPRKPAIADDMLRQYLDRGVPQKEIARLCGVSEAAISQRVKLLEKKEAARSSPEVQKLAKISAFRIRASIEDCKRQAEKLVGESDTPFEKVAALNCIISIERFALSALSTLYSVDEQAAFQAEVLAILEEFEPGTREKVIQRLREKRPVRAALLGGGGAVSGPA